MPKCLRGPHTQQVLPPPRTEGLKGEGGGQFGPLGKMAMSGDIFGGCDWRRGCCWQQAGGGQGAPHPQWADWSPTEKDGAGEQRAGAERPCSGIQRIHASEQGTGPQRREWGTRAALCRMRHTFRWPGRLKATVTGPAWALAPSGSERHPLLRRHTSSPCASRPTDDLGAQVPHGAQTLLQPLLSPPNTCDCWLPCPLQALDSTLLS